MPRIAQKPVYAVKCQEFHKVLPTGSSGFVQSWFVPANRTLTGSGGSSRSERGIKRRRAQEGKREKAAAQHALSEKRRQDEEGHLELSLKTRADVNIKRREEIRKAYLTILQYHSDLSEQIKAVTKDSHVRAENTELMLSYQRGLITLQQYKIGKENPLFLVPHAYTRYLGDLSGGQVLGRITQKSLGLSSEKGVSFFEFPGVTSPNRFKQLYRSRMNSVELTEEEREGVLEEAVRAFELNIEVFDDLQKMLRVAETDSGARHRQSARDSRDAAHEQIKAVTKDSHVRAENTELMLSYQRGLITLQQYKIGKENPLFLVPHAYTRYLGDLSGGQVLGRITQKSLGLSSEKGVSFFTFPGVPSPNRFKQLYRSRMNSVELTEEEREGVLEEAVRAFELNIEVFDDLQRILTFTENSVGPKHVTPKSATHGHQSVAGSTQLPTSIIPNSTVLRLVLAVCVALAVAMGMYAR
ncbi:hypothetical protein JZ751_003481 [Albula glossodonta]|uniref:Heme oxygenase n=1 Tax=Albula glossodonta TaxID=121402 RepID=A0A8T2N7H6_9TELE|nr:hypothetical protein JZ751_003481 [Albula glossodonta]